MHTVFDSSALGLSGLGWNEFFERQLASLSPGSVPARVVGGGGSSLRVWSAHGARVAPVAGRLAHEGIAPVVGDWVALRDAQGQVDLCFERKSEIVRREVGRATSAQTVAANVDVVFVVTSANSDSNPRRLERYLAVVLDGGAEPVIVLNKIDLCPDASSYLAAARELHAGVAVHPVSAHANSGLDALREHLGRGRTGALVGSSGVGKSALTNALLDAGTLVQREGAIRSSDERGRHTTTGRELFVLPNDTGLLIDTPGMRELSPFSSDESGPRGFDDVEALATRCRFRDCAHHGDAGCAVAAAIEAGEIDPARVANYHKLASEQRKLAERMDPRLASESRQRLKSVMRAQRKRGHR